MKKKKKKENGQESYVIHLTVCFYAHLSVINPKRESSSDNSIEAWFYAQLCKGESQTNKEIKNVMQIYIYKAFFKIHDN